MTRWLQSAFIPFITAQSAAEDGGYESLRTNQHTHNFEEGLFSAAKMARLKNTSKFALRKLADYMCAFRARNDKVFIGV